MSRNLTCVNRIKPKLLREVKTEALLVFIRTTLEQTFHQIDTHGCQLQIGSNKDSEIIYSSLRVLLSKLQECVVNSSYLRSLISNSHKSQSLKLLSKKEEPLMIYYDCLIKGIEINLSNGISWIPELIVICLLSEWIIEEEKSINLYPFLTDINYSDFINRYEQLRLNTQDEKKQVIMNMYKISSDLILRLKDTTYKINNQRKSKSRRKK